MAPADFRERLLACLGGEFPPPCALAPEVEKTIDREGFRIEVVTYAVEPEDRVRGLLLIPSGVDAAHPAPGVCVWHQHNGEWHLGKSEPAGLAGNPIHHTGAALAREGYVVFCPDALCFEDRRDSKLKDGAFERFEFLRYVVAGKCMAWKNILDMRRAVDYLVTRPEVQAERLGCYGHSMGSTHAWMVGPWEPRLKAIVGNCCLPTYRGIHAEHMLHCFPNFIPGLFAFGDTPDVAALIAPRALHLNFGTLDTGSPIGEVRRGVEVIRQNYLAMHAESQFTWLIEEGIGHTLTEAMWGNVKRTFAKHLRG